MSSLLGPFLSDRAAEGDDLRPGNLWMAALQIRRKPGRCFAYDSNLRSTALETTSDLRSAASS